MFQYNVTLRINGPRGTENFFTRVKASDKDVAFDAAIVELMAHGYKLSWISDSRVQKCNGFICSTCGHARKESDDECVWCKI